MDLQPFKYTQFIQKIEKGENELNPFGLMPFRILFIAKSGAGKSWIARFIEYQIKHGIRSVYTISPSDL